MGNSDDGFQVILVDLDDTVYPRESGLMKEVGRCILRYMVEQLGLPEDEAAVLRRHYFQQYGTTLRGLQIHHDVDAEDYLRFVHDIPLEEYIGLNPLLDQALSEIPQKMVIFTNATSDHAERVLRRIGIRRHFSRIIDLRLLRYLNKPDPRVYRRALDILQATPEACMVVEDSIRNLGPARDLGMATVLVSSDGAEEGKVDYVIRDLSQLPSALQHLDRDWSTADTGRVDDDGGTMVT